MNRAVPTLFLGMWSFLPLFIRTDVFIVWKSTSTSNLGCIFKPCAVPVETSFLPSLSSLTEEILCPTMGFL